MPIKLTKSYSKRSAGAFSQAPLMRHTNFERVFANFPDLVHSVDENGRIVYANATVTQLLGYQLEEYIGMRIRDVYEPSQHAELAAGFKALIVQGELGTIESCLISKSGEKVPVEIRSLANYSVKGSFSRSFSIIRDMRPLLTMKEQFRSVSRRSARGELAEYIAHDLRSPLTTLKLQAESLGRLERGPVPIKDKLDRISRITSSAVDQIEELLTILDRNNSSPTSWKACDVAEALHQAVNRIYGAALANNISLETKIRPGKDMILNGDNLRLRQLFGNLLNNAIAAVKKQYRGEAGGAVKASITAHEDTIVIKIDDNGVGIDDDATSRIFERGYSTRIDPEGTGLGLSICEKIVKEHGGRICLLKDETTVFEVILPR